MALIEQEQVLFSDQSRQIISVTVVGDCSCCLVHKYEFTLLVLIGGLDLAAGTRCAPSRSGEHSSEFPVYIPTGAIHEKNVAKRPQEIRSNGHRKQLLAQDESQASAEKGRSRLVESLMQCLPCTTCRLVYSEGVFSFVIVSAAAAAVPALQS